ncbi:MAG: MMPL family transporter [Deltaproteobacteria bacterium]|nr:MMPL family transporter [Deltaproteobacteria bacterium]MBI4224297.1 MMPL family transporter [Deltaproteobacteria bacterium]
MFSTFTHFLYKLRYVIAPLSIALFLFCLPQAKKLELRSDFKELLPDHFQSVKDLDRILERVQSTDTLIVAIESDDPQISIRFAHDLIAELKKLPEGTLSQIDYNVQDVIDFFEDNKYLYIDTEDVQELHDRLKKRIDREKLKTTGLFLDLETKEEKEEEFSTKDIEAKYEEKTSRYDEYIDGYFFGEKGRLMALVLRPPGAATGLDFAQDLVNKVEAAIARLDPASYHPSLQTGLTGKFRRVLFEYQTLIDDIVSTAVLVVSLVGLVVFVYFRKIRMVLLMGWAVLNGVAWTFAITQQVIGYLTTQTAFLGAIIVGNGINYSILLMSRYLEERRGDRNPYDSLQIAMQKTFVATLASSVTTSIAFLTLMITQIKGFSHFGFIGGIGMFLCWTATYTVLPAFLIISEQILPLLRKQRKERFAFSLMEPLGRSFPNWSKTALKTGTLISVASAVLLGFFIPRALEYDFSKLRVKPTGKEVYREAALHDRVKTIFTDSMSPAVLVTERIDQVKPLCNEIMRKNELDTPDARVIDDCKSLFSHIPEEQEEKIAILQKIRTLIEKEALDFLNEEQRKEMEDFKNQFKGEKITMEDLPEEIVRNYREKDGTLGKVVFAYPTDRAPLWQGKNLIRFADIIRDNRLPSGERITASGTAVIFADLLRAVAKDGPKATVLAFLAVLLVVALIFREKRGIIFIIGTLLFGVLWMGGWVALFSIKLNFFNFIAIPVTFGIGVDYGVNIYQRYKLEGKGSLPKVIQTTGGAVVLCSLTTLIGYATLIIAKNQALVSFGWIAILGEFGCLATALLFVPALMHKLEKKQPAAS